MDPFNFKFAGRIYTSFKVMVYNVPYQRLQYYLLYFSHILCIPKLAHLHIHLCTHLYSRMRSCWLARQGTFLPHHIWYHIRITITYLHAGGLHGCVGYYLKADHPATQLLCNALPQAS